MTVETREMDRITMVERIRARSKIFIVQARKAQYDLEMRFYNEVGGLDHRGSPLVLPNPPEFSAEEDAQRDRNMITSADVLDLHLSELADFRTTGQPGLYLWRTEKLAEKVAAGFWWSINYEEKVHPSPRDLGLAPFKNALLTPHTHQAIVAIHTVMTAVHAFQLRPPIRDLFLELPHVVRDYLDFLETGVT